jgi:hypothetical protein
MMPGPGVFGERRAPPFGRIGRLLCFRKLLRWNGFALRDAQFAVQKPFVRRLDVDAATARETGRITRAI